MWSLNLHSTWQMQIYKDPLYGITLFMFPHNQIVSTFKTFLSKANGNKFIQIKLHAALIIILLGVRLMRVDDDLFIKLQHTIQIIQYSQNERILEANLLQVERKRKSQTRQSKRRLSSPSRSPGPCPHTLSSSPLSGRRLQCNANILFVGRIEM